MTTKRIQKKIAAVVSTIMLIAVLAVSPILAVPVNKDAFHNETAGKIRKELVTLPFYGVFDNLAYSYEDGIVTLKGQVVRPTTKSDAARRIARLPGVDQVINEIEVLPLSRFDDQIRLAAFRAIYNSRTGLDRLAWQAVPPIHIIVKNGNIVLEGVVPHKGDAVRASIAAHGVTSAFSVINNLRVEQG